MNYVDIFESGDLDLELEDVLDPTISQKFLPYSGFISQNYPEKQTSERIKLEGEKLYWYRITMQNNRPGRAPMKDWLLFTGKADNTKIYVLDMHNNKLDSMQTGYMVPTYLKGFDYGNQYPDRVALNLPAEKTIKIYCRSFAPNKRKPWIDMRLSKKDFFHNWEFVTKSRKDGMLIGFLLTFIVLNFFLFGATRDRVFLYHAFFQSGILVYLLEFFYLLYDLPGLKNNPVFAQTVIYLSLGGMDVAGIQFVRIFLSLPKNFRIWDRIFQTIILLRLLLMAGVMILFYTVDDMPLSDNITAFYMIIQYLALVIFIWLIRGSGKRRYFLIIGTLLFTIGVMLNAASVIEGTGVRYGYTQISVLGEVLVFALGLGHRLNILIQEERQAMIMKEMDAFRTTFYTNVTHEFRTPLTIIQGFVEQLRSGIFNTKQLEQLSLINKNSNRLLQLVNRLLDLSKLQYGKIDLDMRKANIIEYLRYLFHSFQSYALGKGIHMRFLTEVENFEMDFDAEKIRDVVTNLVSNALKFTAEGGYISILAKPIKIDDNNEELLIRVKDSGTGMSEKELGQIFERFYRSKDTKKKFQGSGLGLAITRELVHIMDGRITVTSKAGKGSEFTVYLPVSRNARKSDIEDPGQIEIDLRDDKSRHEEPSPGINEGKPLALIVEDNYDVVVYLRHLLEKDYNVAVAFDGGEGIEKAISLVPDLVISDVVMPVKDGLELCATLKSDERTSHIPIVLATAKAKVEDRLAGLQQGADAYLTKPFNQQELFLCLQNFLGLRKKIQERYSRLNTGQILATDDANRLFQTQDAFVGKAIKIVNSNIEDESFGTTQLARMLGMSRSQLHRKISALTGKPSSQFMNSIRLNKSKQLLSKTELNISEIAYQVGLEPNYFTRIFKENAGISPTRFRNEHR
jgi:signal transduction histidine kinase/CheY-like chemotaxis protein/AraC-like DNA-binding protein